MERNILAISHLYEGDSTNVSFCEGLKANSDHYHFVDYVDLYLAVGKRAFEEHIERLVLDRKITHIFFFLQADDLTFDVRFLERLSTYSFLCMYFFDTEYYFEAVDRYYAQTADVVLLPGYASQCRYEYYGIRALPGVILYDTARYRPEQVGAKDIDVSFVGYVDKAQRRSYIEHLEAEGIPVELFGGGTENGFIDFPRMVQVWAASKINLNFTGMDAGRAMHTARISNRAKQLNGRPVEIALCGGFVLSEYLPGIENFFEIGKEIDCFHSREECLAKTRYYLTHDKEREKIAKRGHERALRDYQASSGLQKVLQIIDALPREAKTVYLDESFIRDFTTYRFIYITRSIFHLRLITLLEELKLIVKFRKINIYNAFTYIRRELFDPLNTLISRFPALKSGIKRIITAVGKRSGRQR